jgi:hypothetical protein
VATFLVVPIALQKASQESELGVLADLQHKQVSFKIEYFNYLVHAIDDYALDVELLAKFWKFESRCF